jgi:hypothetical protein
MQAPAFIGLERPRWRENSAHPPPLPFPPDQPGCML